MKETFSEEANGVFHYVDNTVTGLFTDEEIAERNPCAHKWSYPHTAKRM